MSLKTIATLLFAFLSTAALAHEADHPSDSGITHLLVVDTATVESLGLEKRPRKDALFSVVLDEGGKVESCEPRYLKKKPKIGSAVCAFLESAIDWGIRPAEEPRKLVNKQKFRLIWPDRSKKPYLSSFGGALPVDVFGWIQNSEIRKLNEYDTGEYDFEMKLGVSEQGRVQSCRVDEQNIPEGFGDKLCKQLSDHAYWIPAIDGKGNRVATTALLSARLFMSQRGCRAPFTIGFDQREGRLEIRSGAVYSRCSG